MASRREGGNEQGGEGRMCSGDAVVGLNSNGICLHNTVTVVTKKLFVEE